MCNPSRKCALGRIVMTANDKKLTDDMKSAAPALESWRPPPKSNSEVPITGVGVEGQSPWSGG